MAFNDLIAMKKSSKKPQEGDVFVLQPVIGKFYFGKVIQTDLKSLDSFRVRKGRAFDCTYNS